MCEVGSIWRNRVQHDRVIKVDEVERPEFGEPIIKFVFIGGPNSGTGGHMPLERFLRYFNHLNET